LCSIGCIRENVNPGCSSSSAPAPASDSPPDPHQRHRADHDLVQGHQVWRGVDQDLRVDGPCDSAGYGIHQFDSFWNDRVSSFKVWNNCNYTRGYLNKDYGGTPCGRWYGNVDWVGWTFNDKLSSFWVASTSHGCY
jgi:hypothetical protein